MKGEYKWLCLRYGSEKFPSGVSSVGVMGIVPPAPALKKAGLLKMLGDRGMAPVGGNMNLESCVVVTVLEI